MVHGLVWFMGKYFTWRNMIHGVISSDSTQHGKGSRGTTLITGPSNILHIPAVLFWRELWCKTSADDLMRLETELEVVYRRYVAVIATRVLIDEYMCYWVFHSGTAVLRA